MHPASPLTCCSPDVWTRGSLPSYSFRTVPFGSPGTARLVILSDWRSTATGGGQVQLPEIPLQPHWPDGLHARFP